MQRSPRSLRAASTRLRFTQMRRARQRPVKQAVSAALAYRAQSPIIDGLLKELGMTGGSLGGLTQAATPVETAITKPDGEQKAIS